MGYKIDKISEYIVWLISDFAKQYGISTVQAYEYLLKYDALSFIESNYDVLHTFSFDDAVSDVVRFCKRHGG